MLVETIYLARTSFIFYYRSQLKTYLTIQHYNLYFSDYYTFNLQSNPINPLLFIACDYLLMKVIAKSQHQQITQLIQYIYMFSPFTLINLIYSNLTIIYYSLLLSVLSISHHNLIPNKYLQLISDILISIVLVIVIMIAPNCLFYLLVLLVNKNGIRQLIITSIGLLIHHQYLYHQIIQIVYPQYHEPQLSITWAFHTAQFNLYQPLFYSFLPLLAIYIHLLNFKIFQKHIQSQQQPQSIQNSYQMLISSVMFINNQFTPYTSMIDYQLYLITSLKTVPKIPLLIIYVSVVPLFLSLALHMGSLWLYSISGQPSYLYVQSFVFNIFQFIFQSAIINQL